MSQPNAELNHEGGQPEAEPSLNDIATLMDQEEQPEEQAQDEPLQNPSDAVETDSDQADDAASEQEEEPKETPQDDAWKSRKVKVTIQGEEHEITLEEATHGYMRDQDYRRKTAEVAQSTKALAQKQQHIETELATQVNRINALGFALQQELIGDQSQLKQLLETDPQEYLRAKDRIDQKSSFLAQVMQAQQSAESYRQAELMRQREEAIKQGEKVLLEQLPEWRNEAKRVAEQRDIANALLEAGYTPDEVGELSDPRAVLIARDALLWRKSQAAKAMKPVQAAKDPPKPVTPGTAAKPDKSAAIKKAADAYRRNPGSLDALAGYALERGI